MIVKTTAYKVGDKVYSTVADAKTGALNDILATCTSTDEMIGQLILRSEEVIIILKLHERKPRGPSKKKAAAKVVKSKSPASTPPTE